MNPRIGKELNKVVDKWEFVEHCNNSDECNQAFRKADKANMPVIWIETKRKYGDVTSDFVQVDNYLGLKKDVVNSEIDELIHYYMGKTYRLAKNHHKNKITGYIGGSVPGMIGLRIVDIPEFTDRLADILFDKQNWKQRDL